jgi:hypothetical protein
MITADKARDLSGRTLQEKIDELGISIENAAKKTHRYLRTGWEHKSDKSLWIDGGYKKTEEWKKAKKMLEDLGFNVSFYYNEAQFVDMYTLIEW